MASGFADLDSLPRQQLLPVAHDYMLSGMMGAPGASPTVMAAGIDSELSTRITIEEWMGSSPVYTARMRRLMGIEGDDVPAIMKALQLDVGFVHGYMDVAYEIDPDDRYRGEFWLLHCGALMSVEPAGEAAVFNMCHTIEDPTFDATALATNPRARIRPIHRPPRVPADRHPHCHWTIEISDDHEPVGQIPITERVGSLQLASLPNDIVPGAAAGGGLRSDYRGPFEPAFRLRLLADGALAAAAREFQMQLHLKACAKELSLAEHVGTEVGQAAMEEGWLSPAWVVGDRLRRTLELGTGPGTVARLLEITPVLPPGFDRDVSVDGDRVTVTFTPVIEGLLDARHPGLVGALARGATGGIEGTLGAGGCEAAALTVDLDGSRVLAEMTLQPAKPENEPVMVSLGRMGAMSNWAFDPDD